MPQDRIKRSQASAQVKPNHGANYRYNSPGPVARRLPDWEPQSGDGCGATIISTGPAAAGPSDARVPVPLSGSGASFDAIWSLEIFEMTGLIRFQKHVPPALFNCAEAMRP
jgi:hypothetical protein